MENNNEPFMKGKHIVTTDNWFYGPDGKQYKGVYGNVEILEDNPTLGIKTNMRSTNWYAKVGTPEKYIIIAGCQIHYAVRTDQAPPEGNISDYAVEQGECKNYVRPTSILNLDSNE